MKNYEILATKIMINALEGVKAQIRKAYDKGYKDGKADTPFTDTEEAEKKAYNRGLNEAWKAARKLVHRINGGYTEAEKKIIFDNLTSDSILLNYTAAEAIAKIKAYEDKKQDAEIKVGDEVYSEEDDLRFVVTRIMDGRYEGICTDGACYCPLPLNIKKTGRHAYRIIELLGELDETD